MPDALRPDICVVGAGSGGLTVAAAAAAFGVDVVLVERNRMGGDCLNFGCVPSKALLAAAARAEALRTGAPFGIEPGGPPRVDFARVMAHVGETIAAIAPNDSVARFEGLGVRVIRAEARFLDPRTLEAGDVRIRARRFVLATGSSPRLPPIRGLAEVPFLTNETLFALRALPAHLLVVGGGPVGAEMAQAFRRLGSAVTLVQSGPLLPADDPELVAVVRRRLAAEGVRILEGARAESAACAAGGIDLRIRRGEAEETLSGSHLLIAAGRSPNVDGLGLGAAGVLSGPDGIRTTAGLRTGNRRIYAVGDAAGAPFYTHAAGYEAGLVVRSLLFRLPARRNLDAIPHATFCDPPLAAVGLGEAAAKARFGEAAVTVLRVPFAELDRAVAERRTEGLLKLVVGRSGRLLGAAVVGDKADEIVNLLSLAVSRKMTARDLAGFVSPYPTYSEIARRAATAYFQPYAKRSAVRALVGWLRKWG